MKCYAYVRSTGGSPGKYSRAFCLDFTVVANSGLRFAELVFSAGFHGKANELIAHECLHAAMRLCTRGQIAKAVAGMADEERFLAYPLGRMVARTIKAALRRRGWDCVSAAARKCTKSDAAIGGRLMEAD